LGYALTGGKVTGWVEGYLTILCEAVTWLKILATALLRVQAIMSQSLVCIGTCALCPHSARSVQASLILALTAERIQFGCKQGQL